MPSTAYMDYAETLQDLSRENVSLYEFAPAADGFNGDGAVFNTAVAQTASAGKTLVVPAGAYALDTRLNLVTGARVRCEPGAILRVGVITAGVFGIVSQASFASKISNVRWYGGKVDNPDNLQHTGFSFYGDDVVIDGLELDNTRVGLVGGFAGDDNRVRNIYARTFLDAEPGAFPGGIRVWGGRRNLISGCNVFCADDLYQFAPISTGNGAANQDISDSQFLNCVGYTAKGHVVNAHIIDSTTASIQRVAFIGCKGYGANLARLVNTASSGILEDVDVIGCSGDLTTSTSTSSGSVRVEGSSSFRTRGIRLNNVNLIAPPLIGWHVVGTPEDVHWNGGRIDAPRTADTLAVRIDGCVGGSLKNVRVGANGTHGVRLGVSASTDVVGFDVEGCRVDDVANSMFGVQVLGGSHVTAAKNRINRLSGATSATGIRLEQNTASCTVRADNNLSNVDTATSVHVSATDAWVETRP